MTMPGPVYPRKSFRDVSPDHQRPARPAPEPLPSQSDTADMEAKIGVDPVAALLDKRWRLVLKVADLRAKYGSQGVGEALRKVELSKIKGLVRMKALQEHRKINNEIVDEEAHASDQYQEFLIHMSQERARWAKIEEAISDIDFRLYRGQALIRYSAMEPKT